MAEVISACAGGAALTAWAMYLNASTVLTGSLLALSQFAQLLQFPAAWTTSWLGHRRACILLVAASRQALLPLVALPFLPISESARQTVLLAVAGCAAALGVLGNNAWSSWMSELVPKRVRGRYFGRRTALCTLGNALAAAAVGILLDHCRDHAARGAALALLQAIGCTCGLLTTWLMLRQHDPRPTHARSQLGWSRALAPLRAAELRSFLTYLAVWNAAVGLAGSFFSLHMLRNLKMGFTLMALHGTALAAVRIVAAPLWGGWIDRLGARPVLITCSFGISAIPLIWLFPTQDCLWPLGIDVLVSGVLWCGHGLAAFNLPLSVAPREDRPFYLATFSTIGGASYSLATLAGGALAQRLPAQSSWFGHSLVDLQLIFLGSAVLRLAAACIGLGIREPNARGIPALWLAVLERSVGTRRPSEARDEAA
ncbi:MAG TPA: MFS transporter [Polyangiales bacterium]|nr:MFS transporter [Polyangiales bacterium]